MPGSIPVHVAPTSGVLDGIVVVKLHGEGGCGIHGELQAAGRLACVLRLGGPCVQLKSGVVNIIWSEEEFDWVLERGMSSS